MPKNRAKLPAQPKSSREWPPRIPVNRIAGDARRYIPTRSIHAAAKQDTLSEMLSLFDAPLVIRQDDSAWYALGKLTTSGVSSAYLLGVLNRLAATASASANRKRSHFAQDWAVPSGITRRQLNRIPQRVLSIAEDIKRVNLHPLFDPNVEPDVIHLSRGLRRAVQQALRRIQIASPSESSGALSLLPETLRAYATHLERRIDQVSNLRRGPAKGTAAEFAVKKEILKLIVAVKDVTGKNCYPDLVNLLHPIFPVERAWFLDADALRSFYNQNKTMLVLK